MAFVEDLNGPWLFESMYADDPEAGKLGALPGMEEILNAYPLQTACIIVCSNIVFLSKWICISELYTHVFQIKITHLYLCKIQ